MFQRFRDVWDPALDYCPITFYCTDIELALGYSRYQFHERGAYRERQKSPCRLIGESTNESKKLALESL